MLQRYAIKLGDKIIFQVEKSRDFDIEIERIGKQIQLKKDEMVLLQRQLSLPDATNFGIMMIENEISRREILEIPVLKSYIKKLQQMKRLLKRQEKKQEDIIGCPKYTKQHRFSYRKFVFGTHYSWKN